MDIEVQTGVTMMIVVYLWLRNQGCGPTYETGRHALASTHGVIVAGGGEGRSTAVQTD